MESHTTYCIQLLKTSYKTEKSHGKNPLVPHTLPLFLISSIDGRQPPRKTVRWPCPPRLTPFPASRWLCENTAYFSTSWSRVGCIRYFGDVGGRGLTFLLSLLNAVPPELYVLSPRPYHYLRYPNRPPTNSSSHPR